jgi:hypothetical protein
MIFLWKDYNRSGIKREPRLYPKIKDIGKQAGRPSGTREIP